MKTLYNFIKECDTGSGKVCKKRPKRSRKAIKENRGRQLRRRTIKESGDEGRDEIIRNYINNLDESDQVALWNGYCRVYNDYDNEIYDMDMFDEICDGMKPFDIAFRVFNGKFNPNHHYFKFDGYANFESTNYIDDLIYIDDIIYNSDRISEIFDEAGLDFGDLEDELAEYDNAEIPMDELI